jgi:hypothetical protein
MPDVRDRDEKTRRLPHPETARFLVRTVCAWLIIV